MTKRQLMVTGIAAAGLLMGGGAIAAATSVTFPFPAGPTPTSKVPDVPGVPDTSEPGDVPDASDAPDVPGQPDVPEPGDTPDAADAPDAGGPGDTPDVTPPPAPPTP